MRASRLQTRLSRSPGVSDYLLALGLAAAALLCRQALSAIVPGLAFFIVVLPAVVIAGVFCGTLPAAVTAGLSGIGVAVPHFGPALLRWPPLNFAQLDALTYIASSCAILWATGTLRRVAAEAALAEARLAEVFRQIPGAGAILEAPHGKLLMRTAQSEDVLRQPEIPLPNSDRLRTYGGLHADGSPLAPGDYPIVRALRTGEQVSGEPLAYRQPDGRIVDLEVHAGPVRNADGAIVAAVGMAFDVTQRLEAERRLQRSEAQYRQTASSLQAALEERDVLMHEADHRIKNSLQLVVSLLRLQLRRVCDSDAREALSAAIARVTAIADAHLALQRSPDLRSLDLSQSMRDLCRNLGALNPSVEIRCDIAADLWMDAERALPLGLIASELLTNALRHAFAPGAPGVVTLKLQAAQTVLELIVADDGVGLPAAAVQRGLGSTVIAALARQIGAALQVDSAPGQGTRVTARMALAPPAEASAQAAQ